jgi:hypothetical protein
MNRAISREIESTHRSSPRKSIRALRFARSKACRGRDYNPNLEARAVTLYVFRISEHTRITHILFVLVPVLFPLCHVIKSGGKLVASNPLNGLFAAVTDNFNCFDSRVRRGFNGHALSPFLPDDKAQPRGRDYGQGTFTGTSPGASPQNEAPCVLNRRHQNNDRHIATNSELLFRCSSGQRCSPNVRLA